MTTRAAACSPLLALLPSVASAQAGTGEVGSAVVALDAWDWINLVLRLGAVVAVIWGAFWVLRWYNQRIQTGSGAARSLQVLETRTLGPNRSMQLVRVGHRAVLVGVTPDRINQLLEIDDPDEVERLAQAASTEAGRGPGLGRLADGLAQFAGRTRAPRAARPAGGRRDASSATRPLGTSPEAATPSLQHAQASAAYRGARIAELQRAIEDARRGTSFERIP